MVITADRLRRRSPYGWLFAVPLLIFSTLMAAALIGMTAAMRLGGLEPSLAVPAGVGAFGGLSLGLALRLIRGLRATRSAGGALAPARS
jgi:hypothetical protein